ncbi:hypothetical protein EXIGLDRAFT_773339 [Exidia glandulosa HHB12029]|uniref:UVI-1 protein n=1 Tax=Exidia glandulosa HHB12029 TaxID=1314781 RepID=A0A165EVL1_EXIGL|nr:hypothetical protein EXIGLDRAFT_773339 [Exidia glandulosa HHB12029]
MKFSLFALAAFALSAVATPTNLVSRGSSTVVIDDFKVITQKSMDLNTVVTRIDPLNFLFQGPKVVNGLQNIVQTAQMALADVNTPPMDVFPDDVQVEVVDVLTTFVKVHQALLSTLISKHGLLSLVPFFGPPIAAALRAIEAIVDEIAFGLIGMIPNQKGPAMLQIQSLDSSLNTTIVIYS